MPIMLSIQIAKVIFRQYQLKPVLPNLMLAKITRYTVYKIAVNPLPYDEISRVALLLG